jgi:cytochrome c oxidase cbb3-type subunit IV
MTIEHLFDNASSVMTVLSFITFIGIVWWAYARHRAADFDSAARLPFADEALDAEADHA